MSAEWDESEAETRSTDKMMKAWVEAAAQPGMEVEAAGDFETALGEAGELIEDELRRMALGIGRRRQSRK